MSKNVPITFVWMSLVQDHDWPERSTAKKIPSRVQIVAVAFVLMRHADADGQNVYPAVGTVAELAGVSLATVRNVYGVMRGEGFLRPDGNGRHRTLKYRLIYPSLSSQIDSAGSIPLSKSRQTTNRTELPSAHSSPKGDIVAPSATTQPSVSVPITEGDLVVLERCKDHSATANSNLGKVTARAKSVVSKSQAQIDAENDRIRTEVDQILESHVGGLHDYSDYYPAWEYAERDIKKTFDLVYNDFGLFSHVCKTVQYFDKSEWTFRASLMSKHRMLGADLEPTCHFLTTTARHAFETLTDATMRYSRIENLPNHEVAENRDLESLTIVQIRDEFYRVSEHFVEQIREWWNQASKAKSVSVSATDTGSDAMIVEKIIETVSEKVNEKDVERW